MISIDVCEKRHLERYGGFGYQHIPSDIVPMMKTAGISEKEIHTITPLGVKIRPLLGALAASTGWHLTPMELMLVGERAWNVCAAFKRMAKMGMV